MGNRWLYRVVDIGRITIRDLAVASIASQSLVHSQQTIAWGIADVMMGIDRTGNEETSVEVAMGRQGKEYRLPKTRDRGQTRQTNIPTNCSEE